MIGYPPEFLIRARFRWRNPLEIPAPASTEDPGRSRVTPTDSAHVDDDFSSTQVYQRSLEIDYSAASVAGTDASCEIDCSKLVKNGDHAGDD